MATVTLSKTEADIFAGYEDEIREATPCNWELLIPTEPCHEGAAWMIKMRTFCRGTIRLAPQIANRTIYACDEHMTRMLVGRANAAQALRCMGCGQVSQLSHIAISWQRIRG